MSRSPFHDTSSLDAGGGTDPRQACCKPTLRSKRVSHFLLAILVLSILFQALSTAKHPESAQAQGTQYSMIVFIRNGTIWVIHPDGSGEQQITSSGGYADPALSPDGRQVAFTKGTTLGVLDLINKQERIIVPAEKTPFALLDTYYTYSLPKWSPDGKSLYFIASDGRVQGDSIRKVDLTSETQIRDVILHPRGLDVSSRSGKLAYITYRNGPPIIGNGLNLTNADGSGEVEFLPVREVGISTLCWTWDENSIIFNEFIMNGENSLKMIQVDRGSSSILLDALDAPVSWVACSPQDNSLVYEFDKTLYVYEAETRAVHFLTRGSQPSWELQNAAQTQNQCGHWEWVGSNDDKDLRIIPTPQIVDPSNRCIGVFHLENMTSYSTWYYTFAGYAFELRTAMNNASVQWVPEAKPPHGYVYLIPEQIAVLTAVPTDPSLEASIQMRGNLSIKSLEADLAFFLLRNLADKLPCIPLDKILISAANVANTDLLDPVVEPLLKWPPDLNKAKSELDMVLEDFWMEASKDFSADCIQSVLDKLKLVSTKVMLVIDANLWWSRVLVDHYIYYRGEDAVVDLKYYPVQTTQPTQIIEFQPTGITGQEMSGSCWTLSIASPRDGAWRCMSDSQIFDPCFSPQGETGYVICGALPLGETRGFKLNLTEPLPEETPPSQTSSVLALELEDGTTCRFLTTGTMFEVGGNYFNYGCSDGSILLEVKPGEVWTATKARPSSDNTRILESAQVRIKIVWV